MPELPAPSCCRRSDADRLRRADASPDRSKNRRVHAAQLFVAVLGASNDTFAIASLHQRLPDWIEGQVRAHWSTLVVSPASIVCDNLKAGVAKALWFEPTLTGVS